VVLDLVKCSYSVRSCSRYRTPCELCAVFISVQPLGFKPPSSLSPFETSELDRISCNLWREALRVSR
jgi:hypothetical protein